MLSNIYCSWISCLQIRNNISALKILESSWSVSAAKYLMLRSWSGRRRMMRCTTGQSRQLSGVRWWESWESSIILIIILSVNILIIFRILLHLLKREKKLNNNGWLLPRGSSVSVVAYLQAWRIVFRMPRLTVFITPCITVSYVQNNAAYRANLMSSKFWNIQAKDWRTNFDVMLCLCINFWKTNEQRLFIISINTF